MRLAPEDRGGLGQVERANPAWKARVCQAGGRAKARIRTGVMVRCFPPACPPTGSARVEGNSRRSSARRLGATSRRGIRSSPGTRSCVRAGSKPRGQPRAGRGGDPVRVRHRRAKLGSGGYTEQGRFASWLFRVTTNRVRDETRRRARPAAPTDPGFLPLSAGKRPGPADAEALAALRGAIARLSDQDRDVIELRHHGQMSFKDMAELLGEPLGTLLARHHRALRKLEAMLAGGPAAASAANGGGS